MEGVFSSDFLGGVSSMVREGHPFVWLHCFGSEILNLARPIVVPLFQAESSALCVQGKLWDHAADRGGVACT